MRNLKIERQFKGNVGMFLVAAKLSSMNLIAMPTSRNTKGYDIVVINPDTDKGKGIQIKTSDKRVFPVIGAKLKEYEEKIDEKILCDFVFVDISDLNKPRFFTIPKSDLKEALKRSIKKYIDKVKHRKPLVELMAAEKPHNWAIDLGTLTDYEDEWKKILADLS